MSDEDVFAVPPVSEARRALALEAGWPDGLIERIVALRWPEWRQDLYLGFRGFPNPESIEREVADRERLTNGLQVYEATWEDDERITDLYANSAERIGDWDVTVERGPYPYAQQRMQENGHTKVVADRGVAVACSAYSGRSSYIAGERLSVGWMGGWRVRNGMRRVGYANLLMQTPGTSANVFGMLSYWYVRLENTNALGFIQHSVNERVGGGDAGRPRDRLAATVHHLTPTTDRTDPRVRPIADTDLSRCVELINRTHGGLDLFRPYSEAFLEARLDDVFWGPKPPFVPPVYGWANMFVLEDAGEVVACAGLWDRGRDVRDRWRNRTTSEERVVDSTYVMDVGFADGRPDAFSALLGHLGGHTAELGRTTMVAALEFLPNVLGLIDWVTPQPETRALDTMGYSDADYRVTATITRPYTDLGYW